MALSIFDIREILKPTVRSAPSDDFRVVDSWTEFENTSKGTIASRPLKYLCYKLETINPDTGKKETVFKALKFCRIIRVPKAAKESRVFMDMHSQVLSAVYERGMNFVTVIANMIQPPALGLLFLYGVQGTADNINDAKAKADADYVGLIAAIQGTFQVMEMRHIQQQETEWLRKRMYDMQYMTVVRGIPKANAQGVNISKTSMDNKSVNPNGQGTLEELILGMADYEYVIEILSTPVFNSTLKAWSLKTQQDMTDWYEQMQGSKSLSFNLSIPMMYMANQSNSSGWSEAYTDASSVSHGTGESFNTGFGENVGTSLSESYGQALGHSTGSSFSHSLSNSESFSQSISHGQAISESLGHTIGETIGQTVGMTEGTTIGHGLSHSINESIGDSFGQSNGISNGTSFGTSENISSGESASISAGESHGVSQNVSDSMSHSLSAGESYGVSQGSSLGQGISHNVGVSESTSENVGVSENFGQSMSQSQSTSFSQGSSISNSQSVSQGYTDSSSYSQSLSHSSSISDSVSSGTSQSYGMGQSWNQSVGNNWGNSFNVGQSQGVGYNSSDSSSWGYNTGVSSNVGQNFSEGFSQNMNGSHSLSESESSSMNFGVSAFGISGGGSNGQTLGSGDSLSQGYGLSNSSGMSQSYGSSEGWSNSGSHSEGFSTNASSSMSQGYSTGQSMSVGQGSSINESYGFNSSHSQGVSQGQSFGESLGSSQSISNSNSVSSGWGESVSMGTSSGMTSGQSQSQGFSQSFGTSNGVSESAGTSQSFSQNVSNSNSISSSEGISAGQSVGQGISDSTSLSNSSGITNSYGTGTSQSSSSSMSDSVSSSQSHSLSNGYSESNSTSYSSSVSNSISNSRSDSYSMSQGYTENFGTSQGISKGVTTGESVGQTNSESYTQNVSQGATRSTGSSKSVSEGQSISDSTSRSLGQSLGTTGAYATATGGSMGLGPSIGYSKSYQWLDQQVKDILQLLEYQNERIKSALNGNTGAFYTYVYIACPSADALHAAQTLAKSTWSNEYALTNPLQILDLEPEEEKHLLYHFCAFSTDVTRVNVSGVSEYKYATVLLPNEFVAYTHPPRISEGGIMAEAQDIPKFAVPSMMKGEIYMGSVLSAERYTMNNGYETPYDYRIDEEQLIHGYFTGQSRSGKTVAAMRFIAELAHVRRKETGKRLRIVCMDPKTDWRGIARFVEPERFNFYSLGDVNFHPIKLNPCKIPYGVWPQKWIDGLIDIYCRAYGLLERGKQMMGETIYALYDKAGVFEACNSEDWKEKVPELSSKVTFKAIYRHMQSIKISLEDPKNPKGRAGNDTRDAYARLLDRLQAFDRDYSIESRLFGTEDGMGIDDLIGADDITVLESSGLESTFSNFVFGIITSGFYKFGKAQEGGYKAKDQYETILVIEEANKVLTGNDTCSTGGGSISLSGQSEFEEMLDQAAGLGLFIMAITQKIADMPSSVIANAGLVFAGRLVRPDDVSIVIRSIAREDKFEDRDIVKWFPRSPTGYFNCKTGRTYDYKDAEPVLVHIAPLNFSAPTNDELEEILTQKRVLSVLKQAN